MKYCKTLSSVSLNVKASTPPQQEIDAYWLTTATCADSKLSCGGHGSGALDLMQVKRPCWVADNQIDRHKAADRQTDEYRHF